ncbi:MAG TPA: hypothetical protein VLV45_03810 [Gemmatimonadales bacterium]|jgi:hypothetical protein|nr:hypothetical protein [Gemmatimonadales bacterium]
MDLFVTTEQLAALRGAKHLPDVLARVLSQSRPSGAGYLLTLTYEEATALNELCAWNVHTDAAGAITPSSRVFEDVVTAIMNHPEY